MAPARQSVLTTRRPSRATAIAVAICALALIACPAASAAAPAPCNGVAQIADDNGDGHHPNSDVLAGWFSEAGGRVQAVIQTTFGDWAPAHEDSETAGFAMLFTAAGQTRYVRLVTPRAGAGPLSYDYGTWTAAAGSSAPAPRPARSCRAWRARPRSTSRRRPAPASERGSHNRSS